jgi:hypothetical protein
METILTQKECNKLGTYLRDEGRITFEHNVIYLLSTPFFMIYYPLDGKLLFKNMLYRKDPSTELSIRSAIKLARLLYVRTV